MCDPSALVWNMIEKTFKCIKEEDLNGAINLVQQLEAINPNNIYGQYLRARIMYEKKHYTLAKDRLYFILQQEKAYIKEEIAFLIYQLIGLCEYALGNNSEAAVKFLQASQTATNIIDQARWYSNYLFMSNYFQDITDSELARIHKGYGNIFKNIQRYCHEKRNHKKLKIGYISPDFRNHVVVYFSYQLLAKYDKNRFEVFCYSRGVGDMVTAQLASLVDGWRDITALTDTEAAQCIYDDSIDILFDFSGHSANNCLPVLASKPAPVQISGIGYFNTTGLPQVDYFLTDNICDPMGENDNDFSERLLRLPHSHFCYTPPDTMPEPLAKKIENRAIVFGSFNNFAKITDHMLTLWFEILCKVPGSKIILKSPHFDKKHDQYDVFLRAKKIGFTAKQLEIRGASMEYLSEYNDIDIALDTYPYPGGGTTCEALYMGVPVITLIGRRHGARFGYSILKNIGLEELGAATPADYIKIAVALATSPDLLSELHGQLRSMMQRSVLMNGETYVRDVEAAYEQIWQNWMVSRSN